jgi:2'-5' RNA ligase
MSTSFIRAFFALDFPVESKQHLAAALEGLKLHLQKTFQKNTFRWVKPTNLHVTLQFLGQVEEGEVTKLLQKAREELKGLKSFYLHLGPLEWFPTAYRPQVLSLKVEPDEACAALSKVLGQGARALGYKIEERLFRAHVTLARAEGLRYLPPELLTSLAWPPLPDIFVKEVVLFRSESDSDGSRYTRLASVELEQKDLE